MAGHWLSQDAVSVFDQSLTSPFVLVTLARKSTVTQSSRCCPRYQNL